MLARLGPAYLGSACAGSRPEAGPCTALIREQTSTLENSMIDPRLLNMNVPHPDLDKDSDESDSSSDGESGGSDGDDDDAGGEPRSTLIHGISRILMTLHGRPPRMGAVS